MKKKSGHRRRTKVVRRSRKNLRRTVKRKRLGKSRRRPTRRYSRVQRGGELTHAEIEKLKQTAENGDAEAQFNLGTMFENGRGVAQDRAEAIRWYRLAAAQGHAKATAALRRLGA